MNANPQPIPIRTRTLRDSFTQVGEDIVSFITTRVDLAHAELNESWTAWKSVLPLGMVAAAFGAVAYLLFTLALVCVIAFAFSSYPLRWFFSFLIVAVIWSIIAGVAAFFAMHKLRAQGTFPKKTLQVLKADEEWIKTEARRVA